MLLTDHNYEDIVRYNFHIAVRPVYDYVLSPFPKIGQ